MNRIYVGIGAHRGIRVREDDGFSYAAAHLDCIGGEEAVQLVGLMRQGITEKELTEWYFSGGFAVYDESAWREMRLSLE